MTGLCLDPVDLACAKLVAGREKDFDFVAALLRHQIVDEPSLAARVGELPRSEDRATAGRNLPKVRARLT